MRRNVVAEVLAVALILFVSILLRFIRLDVSLWNDEISTYVGASLPLAEVFLYRPHYFYYVLAHFTLQIQDSEIMLRLPSVLGGGFGVLALYGFARQAGGRWVGLVAALFLAVSAYHMDRSQEARYYAIVMLSSVLMTWSLWRALETNRGLPWLAFVLSANLGLTTQLTVFPYFMVLLVSGAVWIVFTRRNEGPRRISFRLACLCIAGALGLGGFVAGAIAQRNIPEFVVNSEEPGERGADRTDDGLYQRAEGLWRPVYRLTPGQYGEYLRDFMPGRGPLSKLTCTGIFTIGVFSLFRRRPLPAFLISTQFLLVPIPLFLITVSHWYMDRYFCSVYPFYYLFLAVGIATIITGTVQTTALAPTTHAKSRPRFNFALLTTGLGATLFLFVLWLQIAGVRDHILTGAPNDWRSVARFLAQRVEPGDTIAYARTSAKRTAGLAVEDQVFPVASWPLAFYLRRELDKTHSGDGAEILESLHFKGASTVEDVIELRRSRGDGNTYVVVRGAGSSIPAARRRLERIATRELFRRGGLTVSIVDDKNPVKLRKIKATGAGIADESMR